MTDDLRKLLDASLKTAMVVQIVASNPCRSAELVPALRALLMQVLPCFTLEQIKALAIEAAIESAGTKKAAARTLGIARRTIYYYAGRFAPPPPH